MASSTELRVKELLREKGWTTKVLAEKTGMSESYLTHIKNGTRRWNEDSLRKLADAFEISPVELFAQRRPRTDNVESKGKFKIGLGIGQTRMKIDLTMTNITTPSTTSSSGKEDDITFSPIVLFNYKLSENMGLNIEGRYVIGEVDDLKVDGLKIGGGLSYLF